MRRLLDVVKVSVAIVGAVIAMIVRWGPLGAGCKPALPGSRALEKPTLPGTPRSLNEVDT